MEIVPCLDIFFGIKKLKKENQDLKNIYTFSIFETFLALVQPLQSKELHVTLLSEGILYICVPHILTIFEFVWKKHFVRFIRVPYPHVF